MICSSVNRERFIVRTPSKVPDSTQIWRKFRGSGQAAAVPVTLLRRASHSEFRVHGKSVADPLLLQRTAYGTRWPRKRYHKSLWLFPATDDGQTCDVRSPLPPAPLDNDIPT